MGKEGFKQQCFSRNDRRLQADAMLIPERPEPFHFHSAVHGHLCDTAQKMVPLEVVDGCGPKTAVHFLSIIVFHMVSTLQEFKRCLFWRIDNSVTEMIKTNDQLKLQLRFVVVSNLPMHRAISWTTLMMIQPMRNQHPNLEFIGAFLCLVFR